MLGRGDTGRERTPRKGGTKKMALCPETGREDPLTAPPPDKREKIPEALDHAREGKRIEFLEENVGNIFVIKLRKNFVCKTSK